MAHWLVKSEPSKWSWDQQVKAGAKGTHWNGVRNHLAKIHLMTMKLGEQAFFYHSNEGKEIVGVVEVIKLFYPDPSDLTGKFGMVDFRAGQADAVARQDVAADIGAPVGAAGHRRGMEDHLRDGRDLVPARVTACAAPPIQCDGCRPSTVRGLRAPAWAECSRAGSSG